LAVTLPAWREAVYVDAHVAVWARGRWTLLPGQGDLALSGQRLYSVAPATGVQSDAVEAFKALRVIGTAGTWERLVDHVDQCETVTVSGHQPSYHPYLPLVAKASHADVFSFADDMAFGRQKFQHRQQVPTGNGCTWITVPVRSAPCRSAIGAKRVREARDWRRMHWELLQRAYGHLPHFTLVGDFYEQVYASEWNRLAALNEALWLPLQRLLAPTTFFVNATRLPFDRSGRKGHRIAAELGAIARGGVYLCGGASDYLDSPSETDAMATHADVIRSVGFRIVQCTISSSRFADATATAVSATALELVAREGRSAREILRSCTKLEDRVG
jgi:WbqC-like protein family